MWKRRETAGRIRRCLPTSGRLDRRRVGIPRVSGELEAPVEVNAVRRTADELGAVLWLQFGPRMR